MEEKIHLAIATRNCSATVDRLIEASGLEIGVFEPVVTRDFEFKKPDPRVVSSIAEGWGLPPKSVMIVGDSLSDVICGRDAGSATCLLVNQGFNDEHASDGHLVDFAVEELKDVLRIVRETNIVSPRDSPTMRPLAGSVDSVTSSF